MHSVTSPDGTSIAYELTGSGPPLVLVHGTTADHTRWQPVLPAFEDSFTVVALDRRGRGGSGDSEDYSLEHEAADVATVVKSLQEPAVLLGHSYGALCCLEASLQLDDLRGLVLYEPAFGGDHQIYSTELVDEMEALLAEDEKEELLVLFFLEIAEFSRADLDALQDAPNWPDRVEAAHTALRETKVEESYTFDPTRFQEMNTPALLLAGSESPGFLRQSTDAVHAALPDSRLVVMEGQGHVAQNTAPELFVEEVLRFTRGLD